MTTALATTTPELALTAERRDVLRPAFVALGTAYAWYVRREGVEAMRGRNRLAALLLGEFDAELIWHAALEWIARGNRLYPTGGELRQVCLRIRDAIAETAHAQRLRDRLVNLAEKTAQDAQIQFERELLPTTREYVARRQAAAKAARAAAGRHDLERWKGARAADPTPEASRERPEASGRAHLEARAADLQRALDADARTLEALSARGDSQVYVASTERRIARARLELAEIQAALDAAKEPSPHG